MIKVKICGLTNVEDASQASLAGADCLGFIFTPKSPRCVKLNDVKKIIADLDPFILKAGVFMDQDKDEVLETALALGLDILQFHGEENPTYCRAFMPQYKVVKVLFPKDAPFAPVCIRYRVDAYLCDTKFVEKSKGKKVLPPDIQKELSDLIKNGERVIVSSGLNIENIGGIIKLNPYGVDVTSGVESFIGKKDYAKVAEFIKRAKSL